jgi:hypothetical protein
LKPYNKHLQRSNHLEIPRVMGALSASPLITEDSYGLHELVSERVVRAVPYRKLDSKILAILADSERLEKIADLSRRWYCEVGAPRFKEIFISAVREIRLTLRAH